MVICREKIWILETLLGCNFFKQPPIKIFFLPMNFLYRKLSENTRLERNFEEKNFACPPYLYPDWWHALLAMPSAITALFLDRSLVVVHMTGHDQMMTV